MRSRSLLPFVIVAVALLAAVAWLVLKGDGTPSFPGTSPTITSPPVEREPTAPAGDGAPASPGPEAEREEGSGAGPVEGPVPDPPPTAEVSGTVVDAGGMPVAGAFVWTGGAVPGPGGPQGVVDGEGRYALRIPAGSATVFARGFHTGTGRAEVVVPEPPASVEAPTIVLDEGGVIRGRVVDGEGNPRPWIRVRCWAEDGEVQEFLREGRRVVIGTDDVLTDAEGRFALRGLEPVPHRVVPDLTMAPGLESVPFGVPGVLPGGEPITFTVRGERTLRGIVVDAATGEPVPSFTVNGALFPRPDGRFQAAVEAGKEIVVEAPGFAPFRVAPEDAGEEIRAALVPLEESGFLILAVLDEGGEPVAGVRIQGVAPAFVSWLRTVEGPAGEVRIGRTAAGIHHVFVTAEGYTPGVLKVEVPAGGERRTEVRLGRAGAVRLRILDGKGNVARHPNSVVLRDAAGAGPEVRFRYARPQGTLLPITEMTWPGGERGTTLTLSEADGTLLGLRPGAYSLLVEDGGVRRTAEFTVVAGEQVEVTVR